MKIKRNYQFMQFLLDFFGLFLLYLLIASIGDAFLRTKTFNETAILAPGGEAAKADPMPLILWGILAVLAYLAAIVLPLVFKRRINRNRTKPYNQVQYDMWVYGVLLIRLLVLVTLLELCGKHLNYIIHRPETPFSFQVLANAILIYLLIRFTRLRIKKAAPKKPEAPPRNIVED